LIPNDGQVLCDGEPIHNNLDAWHKNIGYVPQDIFLIDDTVKNNILFGLNYSKIDEARLWRVIKQSQLDDFITCKKDLEINIGERGLMISGGQRQRIGIARVLYKNPEIIIFDESTSSLDASNEKEIFKTIQSLADEKTIIVI
jgi:ABC-type multidrug transport system fused ATPase/permease subunit